MSKTFSLLLAAVAFTGCMNKQKITTLPNGMTETNIVRVIDPVKVAAVAGDATKAGSSIWLVSHPNDRSKFMLANESLKLLIADKNYDVKAFTAVMQSLPVQQLQGTQGTVYIGVALIVWNEALTWTQGVTQSELVKLTMASVQAGLQQAIDVTQPRSFYQQRLMAQMDDSAAQATGFWHEMQPIILPAH